SLALAPGVSQPALLLLRLRHRLRATDLTAPQTEVGCTFRSSGLLPGEAGSPGGYGVHPSRETRTTLNRMNRIPTPFKRRPYPVHPVQPGDFPVVIGVSLGCLRSLVQELPQLAA